MLRSRPPETTNLIHRKNHSAAFAFKADVLIDLVDTLYRQKHGLTVTSNYSFRDLVDRERLHPAIVRRADDICRVLEL